MFKCQICPQKDKLIEMLQAQNKDLLDRLMAFNTDAFLRYKAETRTGEPLYPQGVDEKGNIIDYKTMDVNKMQDETFRAFGEDPLMVEEPEQAEIK